jgi:hypothetical protein
MERNISSVSGIEVWSENAAMRNSGQHGINNFDGAGVPSKTPCMRPLIK